MKRILVVFMATAWCAGLMMPLRGAGLEDEGWFTFGDRNLYARFFVDPTLDTSRLEGTDANGGKNSGGEGAGKQGTATTASEGTRSVFNFNIMVGGSLAYFKMKRIVAPSYYFEMLDPNVETSKMWGYAAGVNLNFVFNVAKYFGLGFGGDANYFLPKAFSKSLSYPDADTNSYETRLLYSINSPDPKYYLEVPVYGMVRFYFSESLRAVHLSLGGGADFFLLGHPAARSYIGRAGLGFTLENGFMMECTYQYNTRLIEKSNLTNMLDMHRGMLWMGYCVNAGGH
jgi:hypothetical protein